MTLRRTSQLPTGNNINTNTRTYPHDTFNRFERAKACTAASREQLRKRLCHQVGPVYATGRNIAQRPPLRDLFNAEVAYAEAHKDAARLGKAFHAARTALALPTLDCDYGSLLAAEESARVAYSTANARFQSALRHVEALRAVAPKAPGFGGCDGDCCVSKRDCAGSTYIDGMFYFVACLVYCRLSAIPFRTELRASGRTPSRIACEADSAPCCTYPLRTWAGVQ